MGKTWVPSAGSVDPGPPRPSWCRGSSRFLSFHHWPPAASRSRGKRGHWKTAAALFLFSCSLLVDVLAQGLPSLSVFEEHRERGTRTFVTIHFPGMEGVGVDLWCYEDRFGRPKEIRQEAGRMILLHEWEGNRLETRLEPEEDGVAITTFLEGAGGLLPSEVRFLNLCVTFQRSQAFGNARDKFHESYLTDFVGRAFLFLPGGLTRLVQTRRLPSVDPRDNPYSARGRAPEPWVQEYVPVWRRHADFVHTFYGKRPLSPDRPVYPIIGVLSREGRFLSAVAWPETERLGQLFLSCVHPNPRITEPCRPETSPCVSRGKLYFLENDPDRLLENFRRDFPDWPSPSGRD